MVTIKDQVAFFVTRDVAELINPDVCLIPQIADVRWRRYIVTFSPVADEASALALSIKSHKELVTLLHRNAVQITLYYEQWCLYAIYINDRAVAEIPAQVFPGRISHSTLAGFCPHCRKISLVRKILIARRHTKRPKVAKKIS